MIGYQIVTHSRIPEIIAFGEKEVDAACEITALNIQYGAVSRSRVDTGNMRAGWEVQRLESKKYVVFNNVHYTIYNEYGTVYMSPQPMLGPSVEQEMPLLLDRIRGAYA